MTKVLVVDDVADGAEALAAVFSAVGHEVDIALDGRQALECCAARHPDVVIMDLDMPVMDGLTAARALRAGHRCEPRWLIALTGEPREVAEPIAMACGFDLYMQKPADLPALLAILDMPASPSP